MKNQIKSMWNAAAMAGILIGSLALPAHAQDEGGKFALELNNAAATETGGCRLTYVATNQSDIDLASTAYQVGIFDAGGVVRRILVLEFGALTPGKTRIVLFDLADQPCTDISRIILNTVADCSSTDGQQSDICMAGLVTSSRSDIQFGT